VFQLATGIEVPHGWVAIIDSISVPNVFQTVDASRNKLYVQIFEQPDQIVTLTTGQYNGVTLATELGAQLNAMGHGTYTVVYNSATGQLRILATGVVYMRLRARASSRPFDALEVIGAAEGLNVEDGVEVTLPQHVDIAGTRVLYLTSSNLGHYSALGPRGESDILRAVYVDAPNGSYIVDRLANPFEFIDVGGQQLRSLKFKLVDGNGQTVDMKGRSIAFSIILLQR
jgi:hypothetical protein